MYPGSGWTWPSYALACKIISRLILSILQPHQPLQEISKFYTKNLEIISSRKWFYKLGHSWFRENVSLWFFCLTGYHLGLCLDGRDYLFLGDTNFLLCCTFLEGQVVVVGGFYYNASIAKMGLSLAIVVNLLLNNQKLKSDGVAFNLFE